jgi:hypothetical protein
MLAVVVVLVLGVVSMAKGGAFAKRYGNRLMKARIISQAVAVIMVMVAYFLSRP